MKYQDKVHQVSIVDTFVNCDHTATMEAFSVNKCYSIEKFAVHQIKVGRCLWQVLELSVSHVASQQFQASQASHLANYSQVDHEFLTD
jgi:hypothetical protein